MRFCITAIPTSCAVFASKLPSVAGAIVGVQGLSQGETTLPWSVW